MTDYRQHNVHAEVVQPEPLRERIPGPQLFGRIVQAMQELDDAGLLDYAGAALDVLDAELLAKDGEITYLRRELAAAREQAEKRPAEPSTDDLHAQLIAAMHKARHVPTWDCQDVAPPFICGEINLVTPLADAVLSVVDPLLAAKDAEIERLRRTFRVEYDTNVEARADLSTLDRWIEQLRTHMAELTRQRDEAQESNARLMQEHNTVCALAVGLRDDIVRLVTAALGTWDHEANSDEQITEAVRRIKELRPAAQEAGEPPTDALPCGHSADRVQNDEVTADEHERLCFGVPSGGGTDG